MEKDSRPGSENDIISATGFNSPFGVTETGEKTGY